MFLFNISLALSYIALAIGVGFVIWGLRNKGDGSALAKVAGIGIFLLSVLSLLSTGFFGIMYAFKGFL